MKKIFLLAAAVISLAACNNEDTYVDEPVAAQISATIGKGDVSRASETSWAPGDKIGITMDDRYVNMQYTTTAGDGVFTGTTMYFRNKREPVTLKAYYPFAGTEGTAPVLEASTTSGNQTPGGQTGFDYLYASKENVTGSNPDVKLEFSHKMSKLTLTFKNGVGAGGVRIVSYEISGLVLDGTFDTATGVCAAKAYANAQPLSIDVTGDTDGKQLPSLILFPQSTANKTVTLTITDSDGQYYSCNLSFENNSIVAGNNYLYTVTVNKTGLTVSGSSITDWNNKESSTDASSFNPK